MKNEAEEFIELQKTFQKLYGDELLTFITSLKSTQNLPPELKQTLVTVENNIEKNKDLFTPFLEEKGLGIIVGATVGSGGILGGVFGALQKKEKIRKLSGRKLVAVKDSATLFEETIHRMEHLLEKTQSADNTTPNYEKLTATEKEELLTLAEKMQNLSNELTQQLAA